MAKIRPSQPLVVVVGATGTGKSKLAVEIATRHNGEIINADAVQMYQGLPVVTNKISEAEMNGIPHHLLDRISIHEAPWTVHQFVEESSKIIEQIRLRGKLPVVVGGHDGEDGAHDDIVTGGDTNLDRDDDDVLDVDMLDASTEKLYAQLQNVDPIMASKWHPNDRRKIQRSLEIWLRYGKLPSDVYAEQHSLNSFVAEDERSSAMRYDPLIFWVDVEKMALNSRLDNRVEAMVTNGLLDEVRDMRAIENATKALGQTIDQSKGIWVAIGYNQLAAWLDMVENQNDTSQQSENHIAHVLKQGIDSIKSATRQYSKRQLQWIRIRLAKRLEASNSLQNLFLLDGTNLEDWGKAVEKPSSDTVRAFLAGEELPDNIALSQRAADMLGRVRAREVTERRCMVCEVCKKTLMSEQEWFMHQKSQSHKKVLAGIRKRAQRDEYLLKSKNND